MAVSLPDSRQLSDEVLQALRLRAIRGCEVGYTQAAIAELLGVSPETVSRWWSAYFSKGMEGIPGDRTGRPEGTGRTLSDDQASSIQKKMDGNTPEDLGIAAPLWSRRAIGDLIRKELGISMPVRTVGAYLKRWGYTAKRPNRRSRQQDPKAVREWLDKTHPTLEKRAREEGAEVYWCDETGDAADQHPRYGYAREGIRAVMKVPSEHIRVNLISAINGDGAVRFMTYKEAMDARMFLVFLNRLLRTTTRKVFLIADHLPAHGKGSVRDWLEVHQDRIEMFQLPCHSPELNPSEYLNNDLKGNVNELGLPHTKEELRSRIGRFVRELYHLPEYVASYFLHPCVQYAAAHSS